MLPSDHSILTGILTRAGRITGRHLRCCPGLQGLRGSGPPTSTCLGRFSERPCPPPRQARAVVCLCAFLVSPDCRVRPLITSQLCTICRGSHISLADRISCGAVPTLEVFPATWLRSQATKQTCVAETVAVHLVSIQILHEEFG